VDPDQFNPDPAFFSPKYFAVFCYVGVGPGACPKKKTIFFNDIIMNKVLFSLHFKVSIDFQTDELGLYQKHGFERKRFESCVLLANSKTFRCLFKIRSNLSFKLLVIGSALKLPPWIRIRDADSKSGYSSFEITNK